MEPVAERREACSEGMAYPLIPGQASWGQKHEHRPASMRSRTGAPWVASTFASVRGRTVYNYRDPSRRGEVILP